MKGALDGRNTGEREGARVGRLTGERVGFGVGLGSDLGLFEGFCVGGIVSDVIEYKHIFCYHWGKEVRLGCIQAECKNYFEDLRMQCVPTVSCRGLVDDLYVRQFPYKMSSPRLVVEEKIDSGTTNAVPIVR